MKKRVYAVTLVAILGFGACSVKEIGAKNENSWLKTIPQKTCRINGGIPNSRSYFKNKNNKACSRIKNYADAQQICSDVGGRLPTIEELERISISCGANLDMNGRDLMKAERKDRHLNDNYNNCLKHRFKLHKSPNKYVSSSFVSDINPNKLYTHRLYQIGSAIRSHRQKSFIMTNAESTQYSVLCVSGKNNSSSIKKSKNILKGVSIGSSLMYQNQPFTAQDKQNYDNKKEGGRVWSHNGAEQYCKSLTLGGYNDWTLPSEDSMVVLMGKKQTNSRGYKYNIQDEFLENMPPLGGKDNSASFWTTSIRYGYGKSGWKYSAVDFEDGGDGGEDKSNPYYTLCVRGR